MRLSKWNGHLYNWYNIENLEPLIPRYVSTVDSGNFIGYLYVLKQFLIRENDYSDEIVSEYKLEVDCKNEETLQALYEELTGRELECRILTL